MALDFPNSPSVNDVYADGGRSWTWNGTSWVLNSFVGVVPPGSVNTIQLANSAVTTAKIENNAVTDAKIASTAAIKPTIMDAKGDLVVASANDTVSRLAVGATAGHVLTVDSTEALGVKWAAPAPAVLG